MQKCEPLPEEHDPPFRFQYGSRDSSELVPGWPGALDERSLEHGAAPLMLGDFYVVLPCRATDDVWVAWQWHRPDLGQGAVFVFRRRESLYDSAALPLNGLQPNGVYEVWHMGDELDGRDEPKELPGRYLMHTGPLVRFGDTRPDSCIIRYRQKRGEVATGPAVPVDRD